MFSLLSSIHCSAPQFEPQLGPLFFHTLASGSGMLLAVQLLAILGAAAAVATIFQRLKLEAIPGYLVAGILIGPGLLGLVGDMNSVEQVSSVAVILLMFGIGLQLDVSSIRRGLVHVVAVGTACTLIFTGVCWGALVILGLSVPIALFLSMIFALSSTAVMVRVVAMRRELRAVHARVGLGVNIIQDLFALLVLAIIPGLARWASSGAVSTSSEPIIAGVGQSIYQTLPAWVETLARAGIGMGGVTLMLVVGRFILPRILSQVARTGSGELMLICSGALAFGAAGLTTLLGFSAEMGAFLAGFLLATTPFRYQLSGMLSPMRDLLMAIFFVAVGMKVDPSSLMNDWWIIGLGAMAIITLKVVVNSACGWLAGMSAPSAFLMAVYLASAGEFALVALQAGSDAGLLTQRIQDNAIGIVIVTLIVLPLLIAPAHSWAKRLERIRLSPLTRSKALRDVANASNPQQAKPHTSDSDAPAQTSPQPPARRVIIAGFGPVGRTLADRFAVKGIDVTVIELNPRTVERQASLGRHIVYGDVTNPEVLESAGLFEADAMLITIPDEEAMFRSVSAARALAPDLFIAVRTNFLSSSFKAMQLGADLTTIEEVVTAQAMEHDVLRALGKRSATTTPKALDHQSAEHPVSPSISHPPTDNSSQIAP